MGTEFVLFVSLLILFKKNTIKLVPTAPLCTGGQPLLKITSSGFIVAETVMSLWEFP